MSKSKVGDIAIGVSADAGPLKKGLDDAARKLNGFSGEVSSLGKLAAKSFAAFGVAAAGAVAGLAAFSKAQAEASRETANFARLAGTTTNQFKSMAFAARQYGVEQDKLADILKDTQDKVGDFVATGGGALKDFFDNIGAKIGVTVDHFKRLSGPESLQLYVDSLEKANVSQSEMIFYLEAIASDSTLLLPLLRSQGEELQRLAGSYDAVNGQMEITASQQKGLQDLSADFDRFSTAASGSASVIAATLAPTFSDFFNGVTKHIPKATQAIVEFFNSFIKGSNLSSVKATEKRIAELNETIEDLTKQHKKLFALQQKYNQPLGQRSVEITAQRIEEAKRDLEEAIARKKELADLEAELSNASTFDQGSFKSGQPAVSEVAPISTVMVQRGPSQPASQPGQQFGQPLNVANDEFGFGPMEDQFNVDAIVAKKEELLQIERDFWTNKGAIVGHGLDSIAGMVEQGYGKQAGVMANSFGTILSATATYSKKAFELNKKMSLGQAIVKGWSAATSAWEAGMATGGPWAPAVAASYTAASLAKTAAQIKSIRAQSFGGGGSTSAGGGTGGASGALPGAQVPQQSNAQPAATIVNMSVQGDSLRASTFGSITKQLNEEYEAGYRLNVSFG